jgi:hypothetical protein
MTWHRLEEQMSAQQLAAISQPVERFSVEPEFGAGEIGVPRRPREEVRLQKGCGRVLDDRCRASSRRRSARDAQRDMIAHGSCRVLRRLLGGTSLT